MDLTCSAEAESYMVDLAWSDTAAYDAIDLTVDGVPVTSPIPPDATSFAAGLLYVGGHDEPLHLGGRGQGAGAPVQQRFNGMPRRRGLQR